MVKTRSTTRREREQNEDREQEPLPQEEPQQGEVTAEHDDGPLVCEPMLDNGQLAHPTPSTFVKMARSHKSTTSSTKQRKLQLIMEAERKKASIRMELIEKQLEVDLADLDGYSSRYEGSVVDRNVEKWLSNSEQELKKTPLAPDYGNVSGQHPGPLSPPAPTTTPQPAAAPAPSSADDTLRILAGALKDMAAASVTNGNDANLLTRLSTSTDLPEYSGDPMEWLLFKQAYEESTDLCKFTPKENLWRLRKCLRGPAKEAVSALLISASSPDTILSTLELQFGNPDFIISKFIQGLKKLSPMPSDYHKELVSFSIKIQNFIEAVRSVGREEYLQGRGIATIILSKIPKTLLARWTDYSYPFIKEGKKSKLVLLSEFLHDEAVKASVTANIFHSSMSMRSDHGSKFRNKENAQQRSHSLLVQTEDIDSNCQFCHKSKHKLPECSQFKKALRKLRWQFVKRHRLCYRCLLSRHNRNDCTASACDIDDCGLPHHRLLHYPAVRRPSDGAASQPAPVPALQSPEPPQRVVDDNAEAVTNITASDCRVLLKVVPVRIHGPNGVVTTSALLDDGSTVSLISAELAMRAGVHGHSETLRLSGAFSNDELSCKCVVANINISGMDGKIYSIRARSVNELDLPLNCMSVVDCNMFDNLRSIKSSLSTCDLKPEMLIGQDNYHLLLPLEMKVGKPNEPFATLTPLGWCVHGRVPMTRVSESRHVPAHATLLLSERARAPRDELQELHDEVRRSFALDSMGVTGKPRQNANDVKALAQLEKSAELIDGRWYVGLPWKDEDCRMPDSFPNALKRLKGVERKMGKDENYAERYRERVRHLLDNDFAEELKDTCAYFPKVWYLPHFGVDNPNKKKLRLVFDAADQVEGMSLNDYLLQGPDLLLSLFGIMLRFREHKIAVSGDIKDMFLRVKIHERDRHAFRFLWRDKPTDPVKTFVMTSLIFGANCSPFVAQFIKNKNALRFESSLPAAVDAIVNSHYMDDYIQSLPDESTMVEMVRNVTDIHKKGGFEIRNWTSNSLRVLDSVPKESLGSAAVKFKVDNQFEGERALGLIWYPGQDELGFDVSFKKIPSGVIQGKERPSKRLMLRVVMSVFDIFGFLAPFTIQGRIMLQDTWRLNIGWDDKIPEDIYNKWCLWIDLLKSIGEIRIPRCYQSKQSTQQESIHTGVTNSYHYDKLQLHVFCDASSKAMCAVAYWRWMENNETRVAFVASKCRVVSVKPITIPRSELVAALLAARLADSVLKEHKIVPERRFFWCDSTTVLHWIRNNTRSYKVFEANRLGEIDDLTRVYEWRYVPTGLNVADLATRESFDFSIFENEWFRGPTFLYNDDSLWPKEVKDLPDSEDVLSAHLLVLNEGSMNLPLPDPRRFSSWLRLLRATATVLRFIDKCKKLPGVLNCHIMEVAERLLLRQAQSDTFGEEIAALKNNKPIPRSSKLLTLSPYIDDRGILRVGGRVDVTSDVDHDVKRPVILEGRHPVAQLIIRHYHVAAAHGNQETVVNQLKQKYWLTRLRPAVKKVVSKCMLCRIRKARPRVPRMGDLPTCRLAHHQRPFSHCGLDLFGPMEVTVGRRREKRYGVLFTCLTVRAVHIELVGSLTSDSLIMALRRMAARRGWPRHIYADNGTNIRGADRELQQSLQDLNSDTLREGAANNGVDFNFIPPASPHWGGAWERLIRSVKTSLSVILKERAPRDEVLATLMAEVENIVNSRPLTHVSIEPGDIETLTPNHFLLGSSSNLPIISEYSGSDPAFLRKQWEKSQRLADMFWQRWLKEILPELLPRKKWNKEQKSLRVGDLVLIVDPDSPRNVWPKGVIQQVFPGKDGRIRVVEVRTKTGTWRRSTARVSPISLSEEC